MSKNTKIIAIVGGVLIVFAIGYMVSSGGSTMDAIGCGGKKARPSRFKKLTPAEQDLQNCLKYGYLVKTDKDGKLVKVKESKTCKDGKKKRCKTVPVPKDDNMKTAKCGCNAIRMKPCADEKFKSDPKNKAFCEKMATYNKTNCGGGDDDDE